jgi:hypothetical protein
MVREGQIEIDYITTTGMVADALTKVLAKPAFLARCGRMGMVGTGIDS